MACARGSLAEGGDVVVAVDGDVTTDQTNLLLYYIIKPRVELSLNRFHTTAVVQSAFNWIVKTIIYSVDFDPSGLLEITNQITHRGQTEICSILSSAPWGSLFVCVHRHHHHQELTKKLTFNIKNTRRRQRQRRQRGRWTGLDRGQWSVGDHGRASR